MSVIAVERREELGGTPRRPSLLAYCIYVEIVKLLRLPMFTIFSVLFPTLLFALVGLPIVAGQAGGNSAGQYLMASFGTYAVLNISIFSFGVAIAGERGMGWNKLLRVTALNPLTLFLAKAVMALLFALAAMALLFATFGRPGYLRRAMESKAAGFLVKDAPAAQLAAAIRRAVAGERVVDPVLAAAALSAGDNPLTEREREVLGAAATGASIGKIAAALHLSDGTVRNYLSSAIQKLGAANSKEAYRVAERNGWL